MPMTRKHQRPRKRKYKLPTFSCCILCFSSTVFLFAATCLWYLTHYHDDPSHLPNIAPVHKVDKDTPTFVTIILPSVVNMKNRRNRLDAITDTWGPAAHALYVTHSEEEYPTKETNEYPQTMVVPSHVATVEDGVPRLQYVMKQVQKIYNPDFAFFVNDHTFVIPPHICSFLENRSPEDHLYAGHALTPRGGGITFNSGASGYFLSRKTLSSLVETWESGVVSKHCSGDSKWLQGNPGLVTAECLAKYLNVLPLDTRDEEGSHLFHAFGPMRTVSGKVDEWYLNKHEALDKVFGEVSESQVKLDLNSL